MSVAVRIFDEAPGTGRRAAVDLRLVSERITLRELFRRRIEAEAAEIEAGRREIRPLIVPTEREARLNGKTRKRPAIDVERQVAVATDAFARNQIVVIVGEQQVTELDELVTFAPNQEITFLRLVPLVGG